MAGIWINKDMKIKYLKNRKKIIIALGILFLFLVCYSASGLILSAMGNFLVLDENPVQTDAVVVLNTGVEYYPRLIEAAEIYNRGNIEKVVINGNRKSDILRDLEKKGFIQCCSWYENALRILELLGVPRDAVVVISAEDAYDTVSEAQVVGEEILRLGMKSVIITTSKYHTRRADYIWSGIFRNRLEIYSIPARQDPFNPDSWWKEGRQVRWVMAEYGGWVYDWYKLRSIL
jgi:uncharacterized SAM-binding protein YcdF (DUF218 family)